MNNKKTVALILTIVLVVSMIAVFVGCMPKTHDKAFANSYITVDINPSIEIVTDDSGKIASVQALNDDAAMLLVGLELVGKSVEEGVDIILQEANELNYIVGDGQDAILISCQNDNDSQDAQKYLSKRVDNFAAKINANIDLLTATDDDNPMIAQEAKELGVTVEKYKLMTLAQRYNASLTLDKAKNLSIKELNKIVMRARKTETKMLESALRNDYLSQINFVNASSELVKTQLVLDKIVADTSGILDELVSQEKRDAFIQEINGWKTALEEIKVDSVLQDGASQLTDANRNQILTIANQIVAKQKEYDILLHGKKEENAGKKAGNNGGKEYGKALGGKEYGKALGGKKREMQKLHKQLCNTIKTIESEAMDNGTPLSIEVYITSDVEIVVTADIASFITTKLDAIKAIVQSNMLAIDVDIDSVMTAVIAAIADLDTQVATLQQQKTNQITTKYNDEADFANEILMAEKEAIKVLLGKK